MTISNGAAAQRAADQNFRAITPKFASGRRGVKRTFAEMESQASERKTNTPNLPNAIPDIEDLSLSLALMGVSPCEKQDRLSVPPRISTNVARMFASAYSESPITNAVRVRPSTNPERMFASAYSNYSEPTKQFLHCAVAVRPNATTVMPLDGVPPEGSEPSVAIASAANDRGPARP